MHYKRAKNNGGDPGPAEAKRSWAEQRSECWFEDCHAPIKISGVCTRHETMLRRAGLRVPAVLERVRKPILYGDDKNNPYIKVHMPWHPNAWKDGYLGEHTVVMSQMLGRELYLGENVHHKNGVRNDNRPENLELWVISQPAGQRPEDLLAWAHEIIERYGDGVPTAKKC